MHDLVNKLRWKVDNNVLFSHFYQYLNMWMIGVDFNLRENKFYISVDSVNQQTKKTLLNITEISLY